MGLFREINNAVSGHGHGCGCVDCLEAYNSKDVRGLDRTLLWRVVFSIVLFAAAWITVGLSAAASLLLAVASILCAGYDRLVRMFVVSIREKRFDEEFLMGLVVVAAVAIGRHLEAAAGMILLQLSALLSTMTAETVRRRREALSDGSSSERCPDRGEARFAEFIRRFSRFYTPTILLIAVVLAIVIPIFLHTTIREGVYRALILLVIACPCSLIVAASLTYLAGSGCAAAQGIDVKSSRSLDDLSRVSAVLFDQKTALEGEGMRVISVRSDRMDADTLLRIAAHACAYSDGVYAESIKAAYHDTIYIELIQSFTQEPGRGITVEVDGVSIILGVEDFVLEHGLDIGADAVSEPSVYLGIDGQYAGRILLGPVAQPQTSAVMQALSWDKDRQVVMLTEEPPAAAERFARLVGVGQYYTDCTPEKKAETVRDLADRARRNTTTLCVGDPAKDPDAFAAAGVGFAPSGSVSAAAADASAGGSLPVAVLRAIETAKRTRTILRQSVIGILAFKILVLVLDMFGVCPLWVAVFADAGMALAASVCALRALAPREMLLADTEEIE